MVCALFNRVLYTKRPFSALVCKVGGRAQVGLVSQHNEKFRLLTIGSVFHHPRRDLLRGRKVERVVLNALTHRLRRSRSTCARGDNGSQDSDKSCQKKQ